MANPKTTMTSRMKMMPLIRIPSAAQGHADKAQPFNYAASPISTNLVPEAWRDYFPHMNLTILPESRQEKPRRSGAEGSR